MTIREYAEDVNRSVEDIVKHMESLSMDTSDLDRFLSDDEIILLDNSFQDEEDYVEDTPDEEMIKDFSLDEKAEQIAYESNLTNDHEIKTSKVKKAKKQDKDKSNFRQERKKIYKHKEKLQSNEQVVDENVLLYKEGMTVKELADLLDVSTGEIIKKLMGLGIMATLNNSLSFDSVEVLALDYNKTVKKEETADISNFENYEIEDKEEDLVERPPVVTIMGHVDHGKTTLLDYIRESNVAGGEAGGITQEIGAYQVECKGKKITFIDTPGHAAFTEMRARGASVTDIVIIIVAADDGVMPQTKEAIDHAKAAKVPIIVCINKIDKPEANVDRVMTGLAQAGLTPEEWGGDTIVTKISAKTGEGVDELLENILLIAEMSELKANPNRYATGAVLESKMDKHVGAVATLLIQNGTLRLGDPIVVGTAFGKVRTLKDDLGRNITTAPPSMPVEITGLSSVPSAGDKFMAFETEKQAKQIASDRALREKQADTNRTGMSLEELFGKINEGLKEINVILKTDTNGSLEAVRSSLEKIDVEGVKINIIRGAVGGITESDIVLAGASNAIVIGFNVRGSNKVQDMAKEYGIEIRTYDIIYKVVEDMEKAMKGMLEPIYEEKVTGTAEIRQLFKFSKVGMIAGCHVTSGTIKNNDKARVVRDSIVIYNGSIKSLQHEKDQVKEMSKDHDCGLTLDNFQDYKEGDIIEVYELVEVER
ncbi:MAG TPA: translation initiation factor IF-2 [Candidatus Onthousia excrementipullorum]|uniref:Translation initiation factor IF-2 n=1 Tax=Candidatus Onthousia excrementipullorum TaxID=2840884 RepID=A0A9D1DTA9_9FIRM|nr:translation initiation factor IF-2 [Candidatus Onthousia excrementipullorum]